MPFRRLRLRQFYTRLGRRCWPACPLLLGVLIVSWQICRHEAGCRRAPAPCQEMLERTLDHAHQAAAMVRGSGAPLRGGGAGAAGSGGDRAGRAHRQPGQREVVYCSSLYGPYQGPFKLADYANGQLDLMRAIR